jgi:hypothetical protein
MTKEIDGRIEPATSASQTPEEPGSARVPKVVVLA